MDLPAGLSMRPGSKAECPLMALSGHGRVAKSDSGRKADMPNQRIECPFVTQSRHGAVELCRRFPPQHRGGVPYSSAGARDSEKNLEQA